MNITAFHLHWKKKGFTGLESCFSEQLHLSDKKNVHLFSTSNRTFYSKQCLHSALSRIKGHVLISEGVLSVQIQGHVHINENLFLKLLDDLIRAPIQVFMVLKRCSTHLHQIIMDFYVQNLFLSVLHHNSKESKSSALYSTNILLYI